MILLAGPLSSVIRLVTENTVGTMCAVETQLESVRKPYVCIGCTAKSLAQHLPGVRLYLVSEA